MRNKIRKKLITDKGLKTMLIVNLHPYSFKVNATTGNADGQEYRNLSISYSVNSDDDVPLASGEKFSSLPKVITFYIDGYAPKILENNVGIMSYHKAIVSSVSHCRMWASISQKQFDELLQFARNDKLPSTIQIEAELPKLDHLENEDGWDNVNSRLIGIVSATFTVSSSDEDTILPATEKGVEAIQTQLAELISVSTTIKYALATIAIGLIVAIFFRRYGIL